MEIDLNEMFDEMDARADAFLELNPRWYLGDYHFNINKGLFSICKIEFIDDENNLAKLEKVDDVCCSFCIKEVIEKISEWIKRNATQILFPEQEFIKEKDFHIRMDLYEGIWIEAFEYEYKKEGEIKRKNIQIIAQSKYLSKMTDDFSDWLTSNWERYLKDRKRKGERKHKEIDFSKDEDLLDQKNPHYKLHQEVLNKTLENMARIFDSPVDLTNLKNKEVVNHVRRSL